jgi:hypothetical protein
LSLAVAAGLGAGLGTWAGLTIATVLVVPVLVFVLTIAEQGVKLGRTTHVVDMADAQRRGAYTALSNTISGVAMLGAGVFGLIAQMFGNVTVLALFGVLCLLGVWLASGLEEVQRA